MLGLSEGDLLMKSATRGWNNAERNPMIPRRGDRNAEAASSGWLKTFRLENYAPGG
jgi:hypothetical protein